MQDDRAGTLNAIAAGMSRQQPGGRRDRERPVGDRAMSVDRLPRDGTTANGVFHLNADGSYTYTLTTPFTARAATTAPTPTGRRCSTTPRRRRRQRGHRTVTVNVLDDVPTAHADTNSVGEGSSVNGNVLTDGTDVLGADGGASGGGRHRRRDRQRTSDPVSGNVGTDIAGASARCTSTRTGPTPYDADPDSVNADSVDHFVYTITDGDGDTSTVTLDITVNNVNIRPTIRPRPCSKRRSTTRRGRDLGNGTVIGSDPGAATETVTGQLAVPGVGVTYGAQSVTTAHGIFRSMRMEATPIP